MSDSTLCPSCGYDLGSPSWEGESASHEICPSCGIQFGYTDPAGGDLEARQRLYLTWRKRWVDLGMPWQGLGYPQPKDWDPIKHCSGLLGKPPLRMQESMKKKFAVRLEGVGCRVAVHARAWLLGQLSSDGETWGFFTTRFVEAESPSIAENLARELVHDELKGLLINKPEEPWTLTIDEIWEDPEAFAEYAPGAGFTWYSSDSEACDDDEEIPEADLMV